MVSGPTEPSVGRRMSHQRSISKKLEIEVGDLSPKANFSNLIIWPWPLP